MPWPAMGIEETYVFIRSKNQQQQKKNLFTILEDGY